MNSIRVLEAYRNLFYSPFYVTHALGLFESEGLEVTMRPRDPGEDMVQLLKAGLYDVGMTGIMRSLVAADAGETGYPIAFAELNSRDGFILLARQAGTPFVWHDLVEKIVISYREPPTPWMCLLRVLRDQGIDASKVNLSLDAQIPVAIDAFKRGFGDYIELPEPFAQQLIADGAAHFATAMGRHVGQVPYSSFAAGREVLEQRHDDLVRFTRALYAGQRWVQEHNAAEIAERVAPYLPGFRLDVLTQGVETYREQDTWATDPLLREEGYLRLHDILREGGLITGVHPYGRMVTTTFADAVMRNG